MISPTRARLAVERRAKAAYRIGARAQARRTLRQLPRGASVQLGSGANPFPGWVNVDVAAVTKPDVVVDLRGGFPAPAESIARVYSEHVLEHLELYDAVKVLGDIRCALSAGGIVRIAMPDLDALIERYQSDWRDQTWLNDPSYGFIDSPAHMLNYALRSWGHKYVYSFAELELRLRQAGFTSIERAPWGSLPTRSYASVRLALIRC